MTNLVDRRDHGRSWFTEEGRLRNGALAALLITASVLVAWAGDLIGWVRFDERPRAALLAYGLLFGAYIVLAALVVLFALRAWSRNRGLVRSLVLSYPICLGVYVSLRFIGDQWLLPALGSAPNYPPGTGFFSFALDNLTYGTLPFLFGSLLFLVESQFIGLAQRMRLMNERRVSELDLLRARVAPHFLYNTINNLYALSLRPNADVSGPLHEMAELMRHITKRDGRTLPLADEWTLVQRYCTLQALRYDRPLNLQLEADDRALHQPMVALVLLPLMENAFKHGDPCDADVPLSLVVRIADDRLSVRCENRVGKRVEDDGPSTGLRDLQRLLLLLYDGQAARPSHRRPTASWRNLHCRSIAMPEPLTCLIVDDEPLAVELLVGYVQRTPGLVLGGSFTDPIAAFRRLEQGGIDLVLTDIRMPELSGLQLIKLAGPHCAFIIVSAHPEHAIDGFALDVVDYLQKPASYERFMRAIEKVHVRRATPTTVPTTDHFFLKCGHELVRLDHDEVLYISAMRDYVAVHTRARGRFLSL
ncbi:MAG: histidine kinase [Flavobacteriales bacterium]|nr:MAG: histidine kinase [Flavobacteriales bacterium]